MPSFPTALYLDFDNVFSGLIKLDPRLAMRFAEDPSTWVRQLGSRHLNEGDRRWLVLRCYMNPAGSVAHPASSSRLVFSRFRLPFTDAGFEVVDCPRLAHTKNGADIRMALDAAEALGAGVRYGEFVIASGDSDMTHLLVRLRAADHRTTVVSPSDSAVVLGAIADRLVGGEELLGLLEDDVPDAPDDVLRSSSADEQATAGGASGPTQESAARFEKLVRGRYAAADEALNLAALAHQVRAGLGPATSTNGWLGHGSFTKAMQSLELPGARISTHYVWDSRRHDPPDEAQAVVAPGESPDAVARVTAELRLPRLGPTVWRPVYEALADHVGAHEFKLADTTRWARDQLVERGVEVSRNAVTVVARGSAYGGCPLYRDPAPTADEIGEAFVANVVDRARAADVDLTAADIDAVQTWFGTPPR